MHFVTTHGMPLDNSSDIQYHHYAFVWYVCTHVLYKKVVILKWLCLCFLGWANCQVMDC